MAQSTQTIPHHHIGHNVECPCVFGKTFKERWGARVALILAGTIASSLLEHWFIDKQSGETYITHFWHALIYSTCVGLEFIYSFHLFSDRISRQLFPLNWVLLFLTVTISTALGTITAGFVIYLTGDCSWHDFLLKLPHSLRFSIVLGLIFGISFFLNESLKRQLEETTLQLRTKQLEEERARKLAIAAQLESLESRVRPHFLFNTLNSISALIRDEPVQAERMVERLSALLRFSLDANQRSTVLLGDELKIVNDYLAIEKARFGDRLNFQINIPATFNTVAIPPFALQTLVENSIKHGLANKRTGGEIQISAVETGELIRLEVCDNGPGFSEAAIVVGHGLDNLRSRLYALFGDQAALEICHKDALTCTMIYLPRS